MSIVVSETLRVSCQENFKAGALGQIFGKNNNRILENFRRSKKNLTLTIVASSCVQLTSLKISTSGIGAGTQAVTAPGAFTYKPSKTVGATIYLDNIL